MTGKEFMNKIANGKDDFLQLFINLLNQDKMSFCAIGGLAVNAYAEPVVSLDLDVIVVNEKLELLISELKPKYKVEIFSNSIEITEKTSDLRIQIQTDIRYQDFLQRASIRDVLGYKIPVACIEDVFKGEVWSASDETRRSSKRQKDLADIMRLIETNSQLISFLPDKLKNQLVDKFPRASLAQSQAKLGVYPKEKN